MNQQPTPLRLVAWRNLWNWTSEADGYGSATHLTEAQGLSGKTLCGKDYPASKGHSSNIKFCKRCLSKAYKAGNPKGFTRDLPHVPSVSE